jgi:phage terminase small subunit
MATLTAKQQRFVAEYLVDQNATQAAIRAGYSKKTAGQVGFENLKKPEIAEAIAKRQAKVAKKAEVTLESLLNELEEARSLAIKEKQTSAAVSATMGKAKLTGLLLEKREHTGRNGGPIQTVDLTKLSGDELAQLEAIFGPLAGSGDDDAPDQGREGQEGG